jgi:hypothetical protein
MRIQHFLAFAAAAVLSASAVADPSIPAAASASDNSVNVQAGLSKANRLTPADALHMQGAFQLVDGRVMTVTNQQARLFVELDGKKEELVQVAPQRFMTRDTGARIAFDQVPYAGEVTVNQAVGEPAPVYQASR